MASRKTKKASGSKAKLASTYAGDVRWHNFVEKSKANKNALRIISEGDSWFAFSIGLALDAYVVDRARGPTVFLDLARSGDTVEKMFGTPKGSKTLRAVLVRAQKAKVLPHLLLVSGGGNDILAKRLDAIVKKSVPVAEPVANWIDQGALAKALQVIDRGLQSFLALRDELSPGTRVVFHSYSYLVRIGKEGLFGAGPWVDKYLGPRKLSVVQQREVVEYLLDQFYLRVLTPLSARDDVGVIDLRDKLRGYPANKVWYDEIHPNDNGYQLLAEHYVPVLKKWYPGWF